MVMSVGMAEPKNQPPDEKFVLIIFLENELTEMWEEKKKVQQEIHISFTTPAGSFMATITTCLNCLATQSFPH